MNHKKNIDAWIEYVCCEWLNKWDPSRLRPSIAMLIDRMKSTTGSRRNFDDAWELKEEIEKLQGLLPDDTRNHSKESPQMLLECGLAAYKMGNSREAVRLLSGAISIYTDDHENAVARWLLGCVYWQLRDTVNALTAWEKSLNDFENLARHTEKNLEVTTWYRGKATEMRKAIREAVDNGGPPPIDRARSRKKSAERETRHLIQSLPVIGDIPAGFPFNVLPDPIDFMETHQVTLGSQDYRIVSLIRGEQVVKLPAGQRFYILGVYGNSMNCSNPESIEDGDYVIMREQQTAEPEDIVAAEIFSGDNKDNRATLKRFKKVDGKIYLVPESADPKFQKRIDPLEHFTKFDEGFHIRGVAVAVLKPLPKTVS